MGDYRDEREAALHRAEVLAQQNAQLQTELTSMRQGRASPATTRAPRVLVAVLGFFVVMGAGFGFFATARRQSGEVAAPSSLELRGQWSPPTPVARVVLRAGARAGGGTWAIGDRGGIYFRSESSSTWAAVPSGTDADLYAMTSGDPLLVVGARGTALRFNAAERRWVAEATGTSADLHAVIVTSVGARLMALAVGAGGTVIARDREGAWTAVPSGVTTDLHGITVSSADSTIVAVGSGGTIIGSPLPFDGAAFTRQASPVTATLRAIASWNNTLLAVGDRGVMVSTSAMAPWTVVRSNSTTDLFVVAPTEIPYEERRPGYGGSGSTYGFLAAGAGGAVLVDRLGSVEGWRQVRAGGGAIRAMTSEPWSFFTDDGVVIGFSPR